MLDKLDHARRAAGLLSSYLRTEIPSSALQDGSGADIVFDSGGRRFFVELKSKSDPATVTHAAVQLAEYAPADGIKLLVVPYMTQGGREVCEKHDLSWMDLSGNADIHADNLVVRIEGKPNEFRSPGRPASLFSPKSSRIARIFLTDPGRPRTHTEILQESVVQVADATNNGTTVSSQISPGLVSRVTNLMVQLGYLEQDAQNRYRVTDPNLLLAAWREKYNFQKHDIVEGHVSAKGGVELLKKLASSLDRTDAYYAATGLAAAWQYTSFANFRLCTIYLGRRLGTVEEKELGFSAGKRGSNTWLVYPNDDGVFYKSSPRDGINVVSPVQAYLDLQNNIERSREAAGQLAESEIGWLADG